MSIRTFIFIKNLVFFKHKRFLLMYLTLRFPINRLIEHYTVIILDQNSTNNCASNYWYVDIIMNIYLKLFWLVNIINTDTRVQKT